VYTRRRQTKQNHNTIQCIC